MATVSLEVWEGYRVLAPHLVGHSSLHVVPDMSVRSYLHVCLLSSQFYLP